MNRLACALSLLVMGCGSSTGDLGPASDDSGIAEDTGSVDTGTASVDSGTASVDSGSGTVDSGTTPVDSGTTPADSGTSVDTGTPGSGSFETLVSASLWESMFPNRNKLYTYAAIVEAAKAFPKFASEGTDEQRRREIAALLANTGHETTGGWDTAPGGRYAWGLYFIEEVGCEKGACTGYCDSTSAFKCVAGVTYHGRGPIQLSWNYNYGQFGAALGLDLLSKPQLVTSDGVVAWKTALWFWMTPQSPKPSAHDVMVGKWAPSSADLAAGRKPGFGMTVNIINGGLECGIPGDSRVKDRMGFYTRFVSMLGTTEGENVDCATMKAF